MICWWSSELETNSKRALLHGAGGWGLKRPCVHWPQHPILRQLRRVPTKAHLRRGTKTASGCCLLESETLLGKPSSAPMRVCSRKHHFLVSPLALCSPYSQGGSGCLLLPVQWFLLVVAGAGNHLQTCSPSRRRGMGPEKALCALAQHPNFSQLERNPPRAHLRNGTKLA